MADATLSITDAALTEKLQQSRMDESQKTQLLELLPQMNEAEKADLVQMIEQANAAIAQSEEKYQQEMTSLNEEYTQKMNTLVREETNNARQEFEALEQKENEAEMRQFESVIATVEASPLRAGHAGKRVSLGKIILTLIGLAALAAAGLIAIETLIK